MALIGNSSGQLWKFVPLGVSRYAIRTISLGDGFSLDVVNDNGINSRKLRLAPTADVSGQSWMITTWSDATYRLSNDFTGPDMHLDTVDTAEPYTPMLSTNNTSGQHWRFTKTTPDGITPISTPKPTPTPGSIHRNIPIPALSPTTGQMNEGPTDYAIFSKSTGIVNIVIVFVYFNDTVPPHINDANIIARTYLSVDGELNQFFAKESRRQVNVVVDAKIDLGWRSVSAHLRQAQYPTFDEHKNFIHASLNTFAANEIKFTDYDIVIIAPPLNGGVDRSAAWVHRPSLSVQTPSGGVHRVVTLGNWTYRDKGYYELAHEVSHCFGLPDLYNEHGRETWAAGSWDIMSDTGGSIHYLGWHQRKLGWIKENREDYLSGTFQELEITLAPLHHDDGIAIAAIQSDNSHMLLVLEIAVPLQGTTRGGVLAYTVDSAKTVEPVTILPKTKGYSQQYGNNYLAPFGVGDQTEFVFGPVHVTLRVVSQFEDSYIIRISRSV